MIYCGITGHTGNLGSKFIKIARNFKFNKFKGDITKKKDVENWIKKGQFDLIIHFAALVPIRLVDKNYKKAIKVNFVGTKNLIDSIIKCNTNFKWFFYTSTSHVYAHSNKKIKETSKIKPITRYGKTKNLGERYIIKKLKKKNYCIGRIFSVIDNRSKDFFLKSLISKIKIKKKIIKLNNLNHYRDFISTDQISNIILLLWRNKYRGIINIARGEKVHLKMIAKILAKKYKKKIYFQKNKPTTTVADIKKLSKIGWKNKKLNFIRYFK